MKNYTIVYKITKDGLYYYYSGFVKNPGVLIKRLYAEEDVYEITRII